MKRGLFSLVLAMAFVAVSSTPSYAQGATSTSLSGVVVDSAGGVVPGATVVVKNNATSRTHEVVSNTSGAFSVPALEAGTYTVTVTLTGFKQAVITDVRLVSTPVDVKPVLEVGSLTDTIEVRGGLQLVNTQTATISSTLNADQLNRMPLVMRNLVNAVTFLPGVNTAGANRDSNFNGLPDSFVAISLDGVNNNENFNKSTEGLFAMVTPRPDAVEAITVTTAVGGADVGGHGAVQLAFVTRSGTNSFTGSVYHYYRDTKFNTNYWFNIRNGFDKNDIRLNQYGFRQGGPIVIPKVYDGRNKAFFFVNYEELRFPSEFSRTRIILSEAAQAGNIQYVVSGATRSVNVIDIARANGQLTTLDPTVAAVLAKIRAATGTQGKVNATSDPNVMDYDWQSPGYQIERQPVFKIDYNIGTRHRWSGTYNWQIVVRDPDMLNSGDARFPGFANSSKYTSYRPLFSSALRSTLTSNIVNELKGGMRYGPGYFGDDSSNGPQTFADQGGFALDLTGGGLDITNMHVQNGPSWRSAWSWNIDDSVTWQKSNHNFTFGTSLYFGNIWLKNKQIVPGIGFGMTSFDPADAMFTTANFPGASTGVLGDARELYALLTGRVTSVAGNAVLDEATGKYSYLGTRRQAGKMNEYSLFAQDSWRVTPTLTVNAGLRWDIQTPFTPANGVFAQSFYKDACGVSGVGADGKCRFFQPGASGGVYPTFVKFDAGAPGYNTDWNNLAPSVSIAWRPNIQNGILRMLLGDPEQATLRAGYSVAYAREGMAVFTGQYGANPGSQISVSRTVNNGQLVPAGSGQTYPVLFRDTNRLGPGAFAETVAYPILARPLRADSLNIFHPDIEVAYAKSYTASFQRAISRDMAIDIRYVGTRGLNQWTEESYNEINLIENGFFDEFKLAMSNLQANIAANRGNTFRYFGPNTGTAPLPIYLAYFNGSNQSTNPAVYTGTSWTNTTFLGRLARNNPSPSGAAGDLDGDSTRRAQALAAGLPANFFVVNPDVNGVGVYTSDAHSKYDALQIELRRRLSKGFQVNGSYQYAHEFGSAYLGRHYGRVLDPTGNVRHAFKFQWDYSVPVGRGRRFGADWNRVMDAVLGGWEFNGAGRVQARVLNFGNVRLVGMTLEELTKEYRFRIDPVTKIVTMLPADIILNTRRAYNVSATLPGGYSDLGVPTGRYLAPANSATCIQLYSGQCTPRTLLVRAPFFSRIDVSLAKRVPLKGRANVEIRIDVLNVFDNINFNPSANPGSGSTIFQVGSAYQDISNTFDPGGRLGQIMWRINW